MPELIQVSSSIGFIRTRYLEKKKKNPLYSMPAFARDLGISKSYLSRLFNRERPLTLNQTIQMAVVLDLTPTETDLLISAVALESNQNSKVSNVLRKRAADKMRSAKALALLEVEQFKMMNNWYHLAILNLTRVRNFKSDATWIAKRLGLSKLETEDAIDRLIYLGLLKKENRRLVRTKARVFVDNKIPEQAMTRYFEQTLDKAKEELKDSSQRSFDNRFIAGITLPVDSEKFRKIKKRLMEIQMELTEPMVSQTPTEVYQINFQFFPLTKPELQK